MKLEMPSTPFPTLMLDVEDAWVWPQPPFARNHLMTPLDGGAQPCSVETHGGVIVEGQLLHFDADARVLRICISDGGETLTLPFTKFRRLTLAPPLARAVTRVHPGLYTVFNALPWLRTHVLGWLVGKTAAAATLSARRNGLSSAC